MKLYQKFLAATLLTGSAFLTACDTGRERISYAFNKEADVKGVLTTDVLPCSKQSVQTITIQGNQLEEGEEYFFAEDKARLVIKGDVPDGVSLSVYGGQLHITGDLGDKTFVYVSVPRRHEEVLTTCWLKDRPVACYVYEAREPLAPYNCDSPLVVKGYVGMDVKVDIPTPTIGR